MHGTHVACAMWSCMHELVCARSGVTVTDVSALFVRNSKCSSNELNIALMDRTIETVTQQIIAEMLARKRNTNEKLTGR